jgi:hypothetical protein
MSLWRRYASYWTNSRSLSQSIPTTRAPSRVQSLPSTRPSSYSRPANQLSSRPGTGHGKYPNLGPSRPSTGARAYAAGSRPATGHARLDNQSLSTGLHSRSASSYPRYSTLRASGSARPITGSARATTGLPGKSDETKLDTFVAPSLAVLNKFTCQHEGCSLTATISCPLCDELAPFRHKDSPESIGVPCFACSQRHFNLLWAKKHRALHLPAAAPSDGSTPLATANALLIGRFLLNILSIDLYYLNS